MKQENKAVGEWRCRISRAKYAESCLSSRRPASFAIPLEAWLTNASTRGQKACSFQPRSQGDHAGVKMRNPHTAKRFLPSPTNFRQRYPAKSDATAHQRGSPPLTNRALSRRSTDRRSSSAHSPRALVWRSRYRAHARGTGSEPVVCGTGFEPVTDSSQSCCSAN